MTARRSASRSAFEVLRGTVVVEVEEVRYQSEGRVSPLEYGTLSEFPR